VTLLKFLRAGRVGPFSGVEWPEPGTWLEAGEPPGRVHAVEPAVLSAWISEELWRVELDGARPFVRGVHVAPRGRLVARVETWNDELAREFAETCVARVSAGVAGRAAEYAADAAQDARTAIAGTSVALVAYECAQAAEAAAPGGFDEERRRQSAWLAERLGLL
jgi:hypothetical protein